MAVKKRQGFEFFDDEQQHHQAQAAGGGGEIFGSSVGDLPLGGSATATVLIQCASSGALPMGGSSTATVLVQAASSGVLPIGGEAAIALQPAGVRAGPIRPDRLRLPDIPRIGRLPNVARMTLPRIDRLRLVG